MFKRIFNCFNDNNFILYNNKYMFKNPVINSKIPKIIHQIWIGPRLVPMEWISTWKKFCKKYNWTHYLWTNKEVESFKLINKKHFDNAKSWQQKSDILRYEILYKYGGIYLDADMIWLNLNLEKYLPLDTANFIGVQEPYSSFYSTIGQPYLANGFICCTKNHIIMKKCITLLPKRLGLSTKAFITTGPGLLNEAVRPYSITLIPEKWVFPVNFKNILTGDYKNFIGKGLIFTKSGFEIPEKMDYKTFINTMINRLIYV